MPTTSFDCKKIFSEIDKNPVPSAIFLPVSSFFNNYEMKEDNYWGIYKIVNGKTFNIICTGTTLNIIMEVLEENLFESKCLCFNRSFFSGKNNR